MKKLCSTLLLLLAAAALVPRAAGAYDWPMFLGDARRSGFASAPVNPPLAHKWTFNAGSAIVASPVKAGPNTFVVTRDGTLFSINAYTGAQSWSYNVGARATGAPAAADGMVCVNSHDGALHCLDAASGNIKWRRDIGGMNASSPAIHAGVVFTGTGYPENSVVALDAATGAQLWRRDVGQPALSSPAIVGGVLWIGVGDGAFHAFNSDTGAPIARVQTSGQIHSSSPSVLGDAVFAVAGGFDGKIRAFSAASGAEKWTAVPITGDMQFKVSSISSSNGRLFLSIGHTSIKVAALDAATGGLLWLRDIGPASDRNVVATPVVANSVVYAPGADGTLYALDAASGALIASIPSTAPIVASPALADGMIITAAMNGEVTARFGSDSAPPVVSVISPESGQVVGREVAIIGSARDDNLEKYIIELGESESPSEWTTLDVVYGSGVRDGVLYKWKPAPELSSGIYTIRVIAVDVAGNSASDAVAVQLDNAPPVFAGLVSLNVSDAGDALILSWDAADNDGDSATYPIYMSLEPGAQDFSSPHLVSPGLSQEIHGLASGTLYFFVVRARDAAGNEDSNIVELSGSVTVDGQPSGSAAARLYIPRANEIAERPGGENDLDSKGRRTTLLVDSLGRTLISYTDTFFADVAADGKSFIEISVAVYDVAGVEAPGVTVSVYGEIPALSAGRFEYGSARASALKPAPRVTNRQGAAVFQITSSDSGERWVQVYVEGVEYGPAFRVAFQGAPLTLSDTRVYPNPWRRAISPQMCFAGLMTGDPATMTIRIYDIRGSLAREIHAPDADTGSAAPSGPHRILACWDGTNNAGRPMAAGVYVYNIFGSDGASGVTANGKFSIIR